MSVLDLMLSKKIEQKKSIGICIPDHAKSLEQMKKNEHSNELQIEKKDGSFILEGIYELGKEMTFTGEVFSGCIYPDSKLILGETALPLKEILLHGRFVEKLSSGQRGAITICPEHYIRISAGQLLEFKK
ncbi:MAG: hypothetical protein COV47_00945 [Candidatus Diapherotrites archaeon CG11_big_fil_rev_8_21_14_0_20_37_9]|nr:MAG: hypothetical protein COV47_00945 [Candidatus Diapherotrites archaeon CG11_big_fil_rev_8_21_14_0_20_37_9]